MKPRSECCGWASWGELAGIGPDGRHVGWLLEHERARSAEPGGEPITYPAGIVPGSLSKAGLVAGDSGSPTVSARGSAQEQRAASLHPSRLLHRELVAEQTVAIALERPEGFDFRVGQYIDVTLPEPLFDDLLGPTRSFSVASAPGERDLLLLMRMRDSAFKRSIAALPLGAPLLVDGPYDDFALDAGDGRTLVCLAGGVGIAPFLGMLREVAAGTGELAATLFYSNRRPEDAAYLDELCTLVTRIVGFRCIPTMTRMTESARAWAGETERLGVPMLERQLPELVGPRYYLSGSTVFISGLYQQLLRAGVPSVDIHTEMYTGY